MKKDDILRDTDKKQAIARLHGNAGWLFIQEMMGEKKDRLEKEFYSVDPKDTVKIAKIQAKLEIIRDYINKPKQYFDKLKANGG